MDFASRRTMTCDHIDIHFVVYFLLVFAFVCNMKKNGLLKRSHGNSWKYYFYYNYDFIKSINNCCMV